MHRLDVTLPVDYSVLQQDEKNSLVNFFFLARLLLVFFSFFFFPLFLLVDVSFG